MPVCSCPIDAAQVASTVDELETAGNTITSCVPVGDSVLVFYVARPKPGRPAKPKVETR